MIIFYVALCSDVSRICKSLLYRKEKPGKSEISRDNISLEKLLPNLNKTEKYDPIENGPKNVAGLKQ